MASLFQWLINITGFLAGLALTVTVLVLLPLAFGRRTRSFAGQGIYIVSWVCGIALWMSATAVLLNLWGFWGFVVGVVLLGIGSVPVAAFASLINGEWVYLGGLAIGAVVVYGLRILSVWILQKAANSMASSANQAANTAPWERIDSKCPIVLAYISEMNAELDLAALTGEKRFRAEVDRLNSFALQHRTECIRCGAFVPGTAIADGRVSA